MAFENITGVIVEGMWFDHFPDDHEIREAHREREQRYYTDYRDLVWENSRLRDEIEALTVKIEQLEARDAAK